MNTIGMLDAIVRDVRYGARQIGRNRGFASVAVLTLALGIGSVAAMYSIIHNVLLDPFPYSRSDPAARARRLEPMTTLRGE
jgi:tetrahydromethanopterin S-methyltransferase subunit F